METIYLIKTKCDHNLRWRFTETFNENDYGTGRYIIIVNLNTHECLGFVDVRYATNFNFKTFCEEYIKEYFGTNLKTYFVED